MTWSQEVLREIAVSEPELYEQVNAYEIKTQSRTCRRYKKKECRFNYGNFFSARAILAKPLPQGLDLLEKNQILAWREGVLSKVKKYLNEYLYLAKNNVDDCDSISNIISDNISENLKLMRMSIILL